MPGHGRHDASQFVAHGEVSGVDAVAAQGVGEVVEFGGVGGFVDAVEGGQEGGFEGAGDLLVGGEHEFFNEAVGCVAAAAVEGDGVAVGVEFEFELR